MARGSLDDKGSLLLQGVAEAPVSWSSPKGAPTPDLFRVVSPSLFLKRILQGSRGLRVRVNFS